MNSIFLTKISSSEFQKRIKWCEELFGKGKEVNHITQAETYRWSYEIVGFGIKSIHFKNEQDYAFYLLRWR